MNFGRFGADEAAHGAVDKLGLSNEFAREPAVAVVEQGDMLLKAVDLPFLRLDARFERIALGDETLKGARRIEQQAFDFPLGTCLPVCISASCAASLVMAMSPALCRHLPRSRAVHPRICSLPRWADMRDSIN